MTDETALTLEDFWAGRLSHSVNKLDSPPSKPAIIYHTNDNESSNESLMNKDGFWKNYLLASAQRTSYSPRQKLIRSDNNFWPDINQIKENQNHSKKKIDSLKNPCHPWLNFLSSLRISYVGWGLPHRFD